MTGEELTVEGIARRMPAVGERVVLELVSSVHVAEDIVRFRGSEGPWGRIVRRLCGDIGRQDTLDAALSAASRALQEMVVDANTGIAHTNRAVGTVAAAVGRLRAQVAALAARSVAMDRLVTRLDDIEETLARGFAHVSDTVDHLEIRIEAIQVPDRAIRAWKAGRTYTRLPWILQAWLLIHEIFSSPASRFLDRTSAGQDFRTRVVDQVDAALTTIAPARFSIASVLDAEVSSLGESDTQLLIALFQSTARRDPGPYTAILGLTLEFAAVTAIARPAKLGWCAVDLMRGRGAYVDYWTQRRDLIAAFVTEIAALAAEEDA